jgi:hypothetical protein
VERYGIKIDEQKKSEIADMVLPDCVTKLRSFLGMTNFFSDFIQNYADMSSVLFSLLHGAKSKKQAIHWTEEGRKAFHDLKQAIVDAPMLRFLQPTGKVTLYTDASTYGSGGMLTQEQEGDDGLIREFPIMFVSKVFSTVQKRWATCEQEMFAVYYCVKKLHYLIGGRKFTVRSDHRNLQFWSHVSASAKVERWKLALTEYDFDMEYIKGEDNAVADAFSRVDTISRIHSDSPVFTAILSDERNIKTMRNSKDDDFTEPIIIERRNTILTLTPRKASTYDDEIRRVHGGIQGHWGVDATIKRLKEEGVQWKMMSNDVRTFIKSCPICQKLSDKGTKSHGSSFRVSVDEPNQRIAIDAIGPLEEDDRGFKYILVLIDSF